jgi:uncharacterized membrane protein YphA (DoxX/SURF4 family)
MKAARILFGISAVAFGVVSLMWHDSNMWQALRPLGWPAGTVVAWSLTIAQIVGGIAILDSRAARFASIVLGSVYVLFSLACIPGIVLAPRTYAEYGNFFENFAGVFGAIAVYAATERNHDSATALARVARLGFGICTISFTLGQVVYLRFTASLVPTWLPPSQMFWAILTTVAFALAAVAILIDRQARLALRLVTFMLALFGVLVWIPHIVAQPATLFNWSEFAETFLIAAAALAVADSSAGERLGSVSRMHR